MFLLLIAGSETTAHLISGSVFELAKNPALRDWLAQDWSRANLAIEEFLRFVTPVQFSQLRFVRGNADLGGVRLKRSDQIMALLVAANGSGSKQLPETLDLARRPNHHSVRHGQPFCLGYRLARLEAKCALESLYMAGTGLAVEPGAISGAANLALRSIMGRRW